MQEVCEGAQATGQLNGVCAVTVVVVVFANACFSAPLAVVGGQVDAAVAVPALGHVGDGFIA